MDEEREPCGAVLEADLRLVMVMGLDVVLADVVVADWGAGV
jgi:hypothetical protein